MKNEVTPAIISNNVLNILLGTSWILHVKKYASSGQHPFNFKSPPAQPCSSWQFASLANLQKGSMIFETNRDCWNDVVAKLPQTNIPLKFQDPGEKGQEIIETKQHLTSGDQHCKYVLVFSRLKLSTILPMVDTNGMESTVKTAAVRKTVQSSMQTSLSALHVVHFNPSMVTPLPIKGLSEATSFHQPRNSIFPYISAIPLHWPHQKLRLVAIGGHGFFNLCQDAATATTFSDSAAFTLEFSNTVPVENCHAS